jgi:hypothetical protein
MRNIIFLSLASSFAVGLAGCPRDNGGINNENSQATGQASYVRPVAQGGKPVAEQPANALQLHLILQGDAAWDAVDDLVCTLTGGSTEGEIQASGTFTSDGNYVTSFVATDGSYHSSTEPLCDSLNNVDFNSLLSVQVTATLPANEENCQDFCQASADAECEDAADVEGCTTSATADCETQCAQSQHITGSGQISASSLTEVNNDLSSGSEFNANVDIVFDSLE